MDEMLWEQGAPFFKEEYGQKQPSLTPFLLHGDQVRSAVIVLPGGAYAMRAEHEGTPIAQMLNQAGFSAFVLNYRVAPYRYPAMLYDVNRAIRYVRFYATKFHIDPDKIAVLGFSAGGHLATMAMEHFDYGLDSGDAIDRVSCRPDAGILCYAVASLMENTHGGTFVNLFGTEHPEESLKKSLSGEFSVPDDCPPVFLWHTMDDAAVSVNNCLLMGLALKQKNIPFEMHVFPHGEHGLGLAESSPHVAQWTELVVKWLKSVSF